MKNNKQDTLQTEFKHRYKIVIIGNGGVGKTSLKRSYLGLDFIDNYEMTIGVEVSVKRYGKTTLQIWDLGGQRGFQKVFGDHFAKAEAAVVVFDITNPESFQNVERWIEMITLEKKQMIPTVLVGNKADLRNRGRTEVSHIQAIDYSRELSNNSLYEIPYIEASALTGLNVTYIFEYLMTTLKTISRLR
ncbi:MAG: GTP-binding protein [Candidatus Heimdallarchaeota archaeon]|nr:GTP-binding protein [Candidatus Heimdallarchaeota archaeon]